MGTFRSVFLFSFFMGAGASAVTTPFRIDRVQTANIQMNLDNSNALMISCAFEGHVGQGCLLDTGAGLTMLPLDLQSWAWTLPPMRRVHSSCVGSAGSDCVQVNLQSVTSDGVSLNNTQTYSCTPANAYGLIGISAFLGRAWSFHFSNFVVTEESGLPFNFSGHPLQRSSAGHLYIPIGVSSYSNLAMFDTGVSSDGLVDTDFLRQHPELFEYAGSVSKVDGCGQPLQIDSYKLPEILIDGRVARDLVVQAVDFAQTPALSEHKARGASFVLGITLIKRFNWHLDLKNNQWALE